MTDQVSNQIRISKSGNQKSKNVVFVLVVEPRTSSSPLLEGPGEFSPCVHGFNSSGKGSWEFLAQNFRFRGWRLLLSLLCEMSSFWPCWSVSSASRWDSLCGAARMKISACESETVVLRLKRTESHTSVQSQQHCRCWTVLLWWRASWVGGQDSLFTSQSTFQPGHWNIRYWLEIVLQKGWNSPTNFDLKQVDKQCRQTPNIRLTMTNFHCREQTEKEVTAQIKQYLALQVLPNDLNQNENNSSAFLNKTPHQPKTFVISHTPRQSCGSEPETFLPILSSPSYKGQTHPHLPHHIRASDQPDKVETEHLCSTRMYIQGE